MINLPAHALFHGGFLFCLLPEEVETLQNRSFQLYSPEVEIQFQKETDTANPLLDFRRRSAEDYSDSNTINLLPGATGNSIQTSEELSMDFDSIDEIKIENTDEK